MDAQAKEIKSKVMCEINSFAIAEIPLEFTHDGPMAHHE